MTYELKELLLDNGTSPFGKWYEGLDAITAARVRVALSRLELGNHSNVA